MENFEKIPQERSLQRKRTPEELADELIKQGHVSEAHFSIKDLNPTDEEVRRMPPHIQEWIPYLVDYRNMAVLVDDIEHRHTNHERNVIKMSLERTDPELAKAYKDDNKLQSSNIMHTLVILDLINDEHPFPKEVTDRIQEVRKVVNGTEDEEDFSVSHYKTELDNPEKRKAAEMI